MGLFMYQYFRVFQKNKVFKIFSSIPMSIREARMIYFRAVRIEAIDESDFV